MSWPPDPLTVVYPSPLQLLQYPLFAVNIKFFCDKEIVAKVKGQNSIAATINALRWTKETDGLLGLYRGAGLYFGHQALRDTLRLVANKCIKPRAESARDVVRLANPEEGQADQTTSCEPWRASRGLYWLRLAAKYAIEVISYPLILAASRSIVLRFDPLTTLDQMRFWCRQEGFLTLFSGLIPSLLSTACDEAMDIVVAACIDKAAGAEIDVADKMLIKASAFSVVSLITQPIGSIGTIQRCQSTSIPGLMEPRTVASILAGLPWRASFYQLILFSGILAMNVRLLQWKIETQREEDTEEE